MTKALISPELDDDAFAEIAAFYAYIDLCNEQVFLRYAGRVGRRTWAQWSDGIKGNLGREAFAHAWETMRAASPSDFLELQLLHDSGYEDPRQWVPLWRRVWLSFTRQDETTARIKNRLQACSQQAMRRLDA